MVRTYKTRIGFLTGTVQTYEVVVVDKLNLSKKHKILFG